MNGNFTQVPNAILKATELSTDARFLYAYLKSFRRPAHPSYEHIKKQTGWGSAKITKIIKELVAFNVISVKQGSFKKGTANEYYLTSEIDWRFQNESGSSSKMKAESLSKSKNSNTKTKECSSFTTEEEIMKTVILKESKDQRMSRLNENENTLKNHPLFANSKKGTPDEH